MGAGSAKGMGQGGSGSGRSQAAFAARDRSETAAATSTFEPRTRAWSTRSRYSLDHASAEPARETLMIGAGVGSWGRTSVQRMRSRAKHSGASLGLLPSRRVACSANRTPTPKARPPRAATRDHQNPKHSAARECRERPAERDRLDHGVFGARLLEQERELPGVQFARVQFASAKALPARDQLEHGVFERAE